MQLRFPIGSRIKAALHSDRCRTISEPWRDTEDLTKWLVLMSNGLTVDCTNAAPVCSCSGCGVCKSECANDAALEIAPDPYSLELYADKKPVWMCEPCRKDRANEV
jgi:hypothetical protein